MNLQRARKENCRGCRFKKKKKKNQLSPPQSKFLQHPSAIGTVKTLTDITTPQCHHLLIVPPRGRSHRSGCFLLAGMIQAKHPSASKDSNRTVGWHLRAELPQLRSGGISGLLADLGYCNEGCSSASQRLRRCPWPCHTLEEKHVFFKLNLF